MISSGVDNRCYWWSGYDLLRRLLFFIVYVLVEDFYSDYTQVFYTYLMMWLCMSYIYIVYVCVCWNHVNSLHMLTHRLPAMLISAFCSIIVCRHQHTVIQFNYNVL